MADIREYKSGDEEQILHLFKDVFKSERDKKYWNWLYLENPASDPIIALADDDSKIVGQCTLLPTEIGISGGSVLAGQSIDTMVDSEYRGQGLHKLLAEKTYDIGREKGVKFRMGFPSNDALRGLLGSIGGTLTTEVPLYMNIYKLDNFLTAVMKIRFIAKIFALPGIALMKILHREKRIKVEKDHTLREVVEFDESFDNLSEIISKDDKIMSLRTSKFLNWRIKDHPEIDYKTVGAYLEDELVGYIILKTEDRNLRGGVKSRLGSIVDIIARDEDVALALNGEAKKYFKEKDVDFVAMWLSESFKYRKLFTNLGFHKSRSTIPFVVKDLSKEEDYKDKIENEENWYLMPIESDFY